MEIISLLRFVDKTIKSTLFLFFFPNWQTVGDFVFPYPLNLSIYANKHHFENTVIFEYFSIALIENFVGK